MAKLQSVKEGRAFQQQMENKSETTTCQKVELVAGAGLCGNIEGYDLTPYWILLLPVLPIFWHAMK